MSNNTKIAIVTGGSRGLGRDMALSLAGKGMDVLMTYHSNQQAATEVTDQITAMGRKVVALRLDTSNIQSFDAFVEEVKAALGKQFGTDRFDFLINNAGTGIYTPFAQTTEAQFDEMMNIHFKGVYFLTQKLLPVMNDGGRIINISSGLARFSSPGYAAYASMKGAIETLSKYMAVELGERRIAVNVVAPGAIETDFGGGMVRDNAQVNQHLAGLTALGRVGRPEDIGGVVAFLCTDAAQWLNGQRIEVSGGIHL